MMLTAGGAIEENTNLAHSDVSEKWIDKQANEVNKERSKMTFVNEFVSEEDVEKYNMKDVWNRYHSCWKGDYYLGQKPTFTIDRQRNIIFMTIAQGREEHSNRKSVLLLIDGCHVVIDIDLVGGLNPDGFKSDPYRMRWELVSVYPEVGASLSRDKIIAILKEALAVYGYLGIRKQIPNTVVEFNF